MPITSYFVRTWLSIIGISLANNLDNTGVGVAYGAAGIRISVLVNLWISVITFVLTGSSALLGDYVGHLLPANVCKPLSAVILCAIGFFVMRPAMQRQPGKGQQEKVATKIQADELSAGPTTPDSALLTINSSLLTINSVLGDPLIADRDGSRHIDFKEGTLLGIALSINNVGGGISAGLLHLSAGWTAVLSAVLSFCVLRFGGMAGNRLRATCLAKHAPVLAGTLLIAIGLFQLR